MGLCLGPKLYMRLPKKRDMEYEVGDHVFVKVTPMKGQTPVRSSERVYARART
ncbi:hypothetical protein CsSME_00039224 [Camellia sinensis var. sinensis]